MIAAIITALVSVAGSEGKLRRDFAFEFAASGLPNELMMDPKLELLVLVV
jgi:hypothetical protein